MCSIICTLKLRDIVFYARNLINCIEINWNPVKFITTAKKPLNSTFKKSNINCYYKNITMQLLPKINFPAASSGVFAPASLSLLRSKLRGMYPLFDSKNQGFQGVVIKNGGISENKTMDTLQ